MRCEMEREGSCYRVTYDDCVRRPPPLRLCNHNALSCFGRSGLVVAELVALDAHAQGFAGVYVHALRGRRIKELVRRGDVVRIRFGRFVRGEPKVGAFGWVTG